MNVLACRIAAGILLGATPLTLLADPASSPVRKLASNPDEARAPLAVAGARTGHADPSVATAANRASAARPPTAAAPEAPLSANREGLATSPGPTLDELSVCVADDADDSPADASATFAPQSASADSNPRREGLQSDGAVAQAQAAPKRNASLLLGLGLLALGLLSR